MIYSILFVRIFVALIIFFGFFIIYTVYLIRKYDFIQDNKQRLLEAYSEFASLFSDDRYFSKREFYYWLRKYESLKPIILDYKFHIDNLKKISETTEQPNSIIQGYVNIFLVPKEYDDVINYLYNVFENGVSLVESRNETWVESELENYKSFFDNQDGMSLTECQRRVIVVDEANNLAVAGAGTGKTLTIVSKIGYLLEKKLAKPNEILVLAYARKAKEELEERVKRIYGIDIEVRTFHSFGLEVIGKTTGSKPLVSELSYDNELLRSTLEGFLKTRMKNLEFTNILNRYFLYYLEPVENDLDFTNKEEYEEYLKKIQIRALHGEKVKSLAELELANFLYTNGVNYEYEAEYIFNTSSETRRKYTPDFYLPDYKIWIEHVGIDRDCKTAPEVDRWDYLDSWYWKRKIHEENSTELLETYGYQYSEGTLLRNLIPQLEVRGVRFNKIPEESLFERLKSLGEVSQFVGLLAKFLQLYKSSTNDIQTLRKKSIYYTFANRYNAFLDIFEPILNDYQDLLSESGRIDFNDMIKNATNHIKKGEYKSQFKYILVDEFQDISHSRYRLLKALLDQDWKTKTFCVGDDWQSIYRFTGSDLSIMTNFGKFFAPNEINFLNETFRFNEKIANFSASFIMKNPAQYAKQLISKPSHDKAIKLIWYDDLNEALQQALTDIKNNSLGSNVFLLSRYKKQYYDELVNSQNLIIKDEDDLGIEYLTVHSSKGKQADNVILFGLQSGRYGFPCGIEDDPVLNLVLSEDNKYPNAEERRVFYVGLTRTKNNVYLLANRNRVSNFVSEILAEETEIEVLGEAPNLVKCPKCEKGVINRIEWNDDFFFSCSRYPVCTYRPMRCPVCKEGFLYLESSNDDTYHCSNESCNYSPKKCPECGGILLRRAGNPDFYGCSNYFTNNCRYKEELETIDDVLDNS